MARRGRKRKNAPRHPSGQTVRKERVDEVRETAVAARERVYGLGKEAARRVEATSAIGRALLQKELTRIQFEAAEEYERVAGEFRATIGAKAQRSAGDFNGPGGFDGSEGDNPLFVERCQRARRDMARSRRALLKADPLAQMAVDAWVLENREAWGLLGELRLGLNALARIYRVHEWTGEKAA